MSFVDVDDLAGDVVPGVVLASVAMGVGAALGAFGLVLDGGDHRLCEGRLVVGWYQPAVGLARGDVDEAGRTAAERADHG